MVYRVVKGGRLIKVPTRDDRVVEKAMAAAARQPKTVPVVDVNLEGDDDSDPKPKTRRKKPGRGTKKRKTKKR